MALLSRTPVRSTRAAGDPLAEQVQAAAGRGDADAVERLVAEAGTDWDRRDRLVAVVAERPEARWVDDWVEARPESATACTAAAAVACARAWLARGHGRGNDVTEDQADGWFAELERAEELLGRAVRLDGADPTPWAYALLTARGLELPPEDRRERWEGLRRRDPLHRHGARQALRGASPQWSGSREELLALVDEATRDAPPGAGVHALWPEAHVELWRWNGMQDPPDLEAEARYWDDPQVRDQVVQAYERYAAAPPLQPAWALDDANLFAFALPLVGDRALAADAFRRTGGVATEHPWDYLEPSVGRSFRSARSAVGG